MWHTKLEVNASPLFSRRFSLFSLYYNLVNNRDKIHVIFSKPKFRAEHEYHFSFREIRQTNPQPTDYKSKMSSDDEKWLRSAQKATIYAGFNEKIDVEYDDKFIYNINT